MGIASDRGLYNWTVHQLYVCGSVWFIISFNIRNMQLRSWHLWSSILSFSLPLSFPLTSFKFGEYVVEKSSRKTGLKARGSLLETTFTCLSNIYQSSLTFRRRYSSYVYIYNIYVYVYYIYMRIKLNFNGHNSRIGAWKKSREWVLALRCEAQ